MMPMPRSRSDSEPSPLEKTRPTIGLLCDVPCNQYSCDMWAGVRDAARAFDVNLCYFAGGILKIPYAYKDQANVIYDRASSATLDGLVLWGGQLSHVVGAEGVRAFCERFRPLPMVSIELVLPGVPSLFVDNYQGMYDVVTHLIEVHGYRRIAYIDYPTC
jgi:DNA-binding LacI/PurR family transcriptional regulator